MPVTRVFVVAHVRLYREGLADLLARAGFDVVGTGVDADSCSAALSAAQPDIVLLDVVGAADVAAIRQLVSALPGAAVVVFGLSGSNNGVLACAEAGARGYVTRDQSGDGLVEVLKSVARDEALCSPRIAAALMKRVAALAPPGPAEAEVRLTRREFEIATLVEQGLSNKEIAQRLVIEVATVKSHMHNILEKLKATRRADAAAWVRGHPQLRQSR
jgi:two-component system, NarL family, nitrate/nitrite response regulator NarL